MKGKKEKTRTEVKGQEVNSPNPDTEEKTASHH